MPRNFSIYLDLIRFSAALIVFLGHAAGMNWTGGFLWQLGGYADTCVVVFFVLSGFVIAYVTDVKEHSWQLYAASRISRIWSIVIPALILTLFIDTLGVNVAPELYINQPWYGGDHLTLRYVASFFMLHEAWHLKLVPGINAPFWSLSFEAFYYLTFAIIFFFKNKIRFLAAAVVMAVGGPLIAILFPIWLLGCLAYRQTRQTNITKLKSIACFSGGIALLLAAPYLRSFDSQFQVLGESVIGRYFDALAFYVHLIGAYGLFRNGTALKNSVYILISRLASTTFALYLFHRPLIQFFSYIGPEDPNSVGRRVLVIGGTIGVVFLL